MQKSQSPQSAQSLPKPILTVKELAEELGIGTGKAYEIANSQHIKVVRLGARCIRIRRTDLEEFLDSGGLEQIGT